MSSLPPQVIVLIGATASGKTELAIEIAEHFKTHIHNIDSVSYTHLTLPTT